MYKTETNPLTKAMVPLDHQIHGQLDDPVPSQMSLCWIIVGGRGQGKTSLVLNWLKTMKRKYDTIHLVSKTYKADMHSKKALKSLVEELEDDDHVHTEITDALATEMITEIQEYNESFDRKKHKREPAHLVILDDQLSSLPRGRLNSSILDLCVNGRHLRTTLVILVQKYYSIPTTIRANSQLITMFPTQSKREFKALEDDLNVDPTLLVSLYEFATSEERSFLHINLFGSRPVFYKKFDRIIL